MHGKPMIRRRGNAKARSTLYMSALSAVRVNTDMKRWVQSLRARGMGKKASLIAVVNKLARILYGILSTGQPYDARRAFPDYYPHDEQQAA